MGIGDQPLLQLELRLGVEIELDPPRRVPLLVLQRDRQTASLLLDAHDPGIHAKIHGICK